MLNASTRFDLPTRRAFLAGMARSCFGVSLLPIGGAVNAWGAPQAASAGAKVKSVIYLFMRGGMSHLDTFDPKPEAGPDIQGPVEPIATNVPGVQFTEYLPRLAQRMDRLALLRAMHHTQGAHEPGEYLLRTGFEKQTGIRHPALGAWVMELSPKVQRDLPGYVRVGDLGGHPANGFFEVRNGPLPISNATKGLQNGKLRSGTSVAEFESGLALSAALDREFAATYDLPQVRAYGDLYDDAVRLMKSKDLAAFDLNEESDRMRERYGDTPFGQGCLLARRLIEKGVAFVELDYGDWDTHVANHTGVKELCGPLDQTLSTLLDDLTERGLNESTLVVVASEFGRMPKLDEFAGRGHWPLAFTCMLAGAGIRGGTVHGATDARGENVAEGQTSVLDLHATIAHLLGLSVDQKRSPASGGQEFQIVGKDTGTKGQIIADILNTA